MSGQHQLSALINKLAKCVYHVKENYRQQKKLPAAKASNSGSRIGGYLMLIEWYSWKLTNERSVCKKNIIVHRQWGKNIEYKFVKHYDTVSLLTV